MAGKVLFILMPNDFQDIEFLAPYQLLKSEGFAVDVAGFLAEPATGSQGHKQPVDLVWHEMSVQDLNKYDAVVIPGGKGSPKHLWGNEPLQSLVRYFHQHQKLVAAICYACIVPVEAEILQGKKATVYPTDEAKAILDKHKTFFVDQPLVVLSKEKIITAQGPQVADAFADAIVKTLSQASSL